MRVNVRVRVRVTVRVRVRVTVRVRVRVTVRVRVPQCLGYQNAEKASRIRGLPNVWRTWGVGTGCTGGGRYGVRVSHAP